MLSILRLGVANIGNSGNPKSAIYLSRPITLEGTHSFSGRANDETRKIQVFNNQVNVLLIDVRAMAEKFNAAGNNAVTTGDYEAAVKVSICIARALVSSNVTEFVDMAVLH